MTKHPQHRVQTLDSLSEALQRLHAVKHMSWREIAALGRFQGIAPGTLCSIANGRDPKDAHTRALLNLPALVLAPACPTCGEVHVTKRCMQKSSAKPRTWVRVLGHAGWELK